MIYTCCKKLLSLQSSSSLLFLRALPSLSPSLHGKIPLCFFADRVTKIKIFQRFSPLSFSLSPPPILSPRAEFTVPRTLDVGVPRSRYLFFVSVIDIVRLLGLCCLVRSSFQSQVARDRKNKNSYVRRGRGEGKFTRSLKVSCNDEFSCDS